MIHDIYNLPGSVSDVADFIVVGSGAGGGACAYKLTDGGADVILLEEGPAVSKDQFVPSVYVSMQRMFRDLGATTTYGSVMVPMLQGRVLGGGTVINSAITWRLPRDVWEMWRDGHNLGNALPWDDLERIFTSIEEKLNPKEANPQVLGRSSELLAEGCDKLGYKWRLTRRIESGCDGSCRCLQGCPGGFKNSNDKTFIPWAMEKGMRVYATCKVEQILHDGAKVLGVRARFRDPVTGEKRLLGDFRAKKGVILAGGAVQSPYLLLKSGLGKRNRNIGVGFTAHPGSGVTGIFPDAVNMYQGVTQGWECTQFREQRMKLENISMPLELAALRLPGLGRKLMDQLELFPHALIAAVAVRSTSRGRVYCMAGNPVVRYTPNRVDSNILIKGIKELSRIMLAAGAEYVIPSVYGFKERIIGEADLAAVDSIPREPKRFNWVATHIMSSARIGINHRKGAIDQDFQVYGAPGVYVADASCLPTNIGVNPQHTIMAMAWLCAEKLLKKA